MPQPRNLSIQVLLVCGGLLATFAALSWLSVTQESATTDEPLNCVGAWVQHTLRDYRIDREDPPLCARLAMLAQPKGALHIDTQSPQWNAIPTQMWFANPYAVRMLYQTAGNDGDAFLRRSRIVFLILGELLAILIAAWAWQLAGPVAGVVALTLFSFDPNFLAHAPLVKNDVPLTLAWIGCACALSFACRRVTIASALAIALCCALGAGMKFSGVMLVPLASIILLLRALSNPPWPIANQIARTRKTKLIAAAAVIAFSSLLTYAAVWSYYGFRYAPTPDPTIHLDLESSAVLARRYTAMIRTDHVPPSPEEVDATPEPLGVSSVRWIDQHRLMPNAWCAGMMYTFASTLARPTFLLGEYGWKGWWYYFPLAATFKTPLATLAAGALAMIFIIRRRAWRSEQFRWAMLGLFVSTTLYAFLAMRSNTDIGLRHFLPVYPACYICIGVVAAKVWASSRTRLLIIALATALVGETLHAYPNYIPFFNVAAGGSRGGARLLSDSNLDWGQDLKCLVAWQYAHPDVPLYAAYVGSVDPSFYGLRYTPLEGNSNPPSTNGIPTQPGVMVISVGLIQGTYGQTQRNALYAPLRDRPPLEVLGGSIYIYQVP